MRIAGLAVEAHARLVLVDGGLVARRLGLADDLQGDGAAVALVDGLVDDPHAAAADPLQDPVVGDPLDGAGQGPRQRPVPAGGGAQEDVRGVAAREVDLRGEGEEDAVAGDLPHDDAHVRDLGQVQGEDVREELVGEVADRREQSLLTEATGTNEPGMYADTMTSHDAPPTSCRMRFVR